MFALFWLFLFGPPPHTACGTSLCRASEYCVYATGGLHYQPHQFDRVGDDGLMHTARCWPAPSTCATSPSCACLRAADITGADRCTEDHGAVSITLLEP